MDVLVLKLGTLRGILAGPPEYLGVDGAACSMPLPTGEQPGCGLVREPAPVDTQGIE